MSERSDTSTQGERRRWLDEPGNVKKVIYTLFAVCGALLLIDVLDLLHVLYHKHTHYGFEKWFGFYGFFGFFGSVGLVLVAKAMRKVLMRGEDYYDR